MFDDEIAVHRELIGFDFASLQPLGYIVRAAGQRTAGKSTHTGGGGERRAFAEHATISEIIREALRRFLEGA